MHVYIDSIHTDIKIYSLKKKSDMHLFLISNNFYPAERLNRFTDMQMHLPTQRT